MLLSATLSMMACAAYGGPASPWETGPDGSSDAGPASPWEAGPDGSPDAVEEPSPDPCSCADGASTPGAAAVALSAGSGHTCAITKHGALRCWGDNEHGQLGNGTTWTSGASEPSPAQVVTLDADVVAVAAGGSHTCALKQDRSAWCWGDNSHGQLGDGTDPFVHDSYASVPRPVTLLEGVAMELAVGTVHTCAVTQDESLWCWGAYFPEDPANQMDSIETSTPARISSLGTGVVDVAAGSFHTCALKADRTIWCWGDNQVGQLGFGGGGARRPEDPVLVTGIEGMPMKLSAGTWHTCALLTDNSVWCWGGDDVGQLGRGSVSSRAEPARVEWPAVPGLPDGIACGGLHTCARSVDQRAWCWGWNAYHQLGLGPTAPAQTTVQPSPSPVCSLCSTEQVVAGAAHSCALSAAGGVWCWGDNQFGQIGVAGPSPEPTPRPVNLGDDVP